IDESIIDICTAPEKEFFEFKKRFLAPGRCILEDKLLSIYEMEAGGKKIQFWAFNVSWTSQVPEQQGNVVFPVKPYQEVARDEEADYRIALLHHPLNWYAQSTYHTFREFLLNNFCIVLSGHEHISGNHQILRSIDDTAGTQMI